MPDVPDPLPFSLCRYPGRADGRSAMGNLTPVRRPWSDPCERFFSRARARPYRDRTRDVDRIRNTPPPCPHLHLEPSDHSPIPAHLPPSPAVKMSTASRLREETWRGHMHQARTSQGCHSMLSPSSHPQSSPAQHGYSQHHLNISQPRRRRLRRRAARAAPRPPPGRAS